MISLLMAVQHQPFSTNLSQSAPQRPPNYSAARQQTYSGTSCSSIFKNGTVGQSAYTRLMNQDIRQYYCDHCKMAGHSTQRCYKIHGYPPGHKLYRGRRVAAAFHNDTTINFPSPSASPISGLSSEQYTQVMQLLSKPSSDTESATIGTTSLMPGKGFCMFTSFGNHNWIIDSGATDHITYDLSLLHNVKAIQVPCYITLPNLKKSTSEKYWFSISEPRFGAGKYFTYSRISVSFTLYQQTYTTVFC